VKRSEMIKIMRIASAAGPSAENLDRYFSNILDKMEEAGMLPPIRLVEGNASCEWEPENDE
jgi:hypothetical protein